MSMPQRVGAVLSEHGYARMRYQLTPAEIAVQMSNLKLEVPEHIHPVLLNCGSAAELNFVGEFAMRDGCGVLDHRALRCGATDVRLQHRVNGYRVDLMAERKGFMLAIEVDGMGWHHMTPEQVAADYLRERRLVLVGCSVVRFTAAEVFRDRQECWRQVDAILEARTRGA